MMIMIMATTMVIDIMMVMMTAVMVMARTCMSQFHSGTSLSEAEGNVVVYLHLCSMTHNVLIV
jgi:hypothetical protein